ncbi:hypothetical protein BDV95DRAFT_541173 [Massariosphaeria phaeospora]|uniref:Uncharacterized protein n=1 Tax=Massariosphaeria phaeospora TaxID=100035 RepID=A0A7C8MNY8_9PLEO|nr:hypothetical protein BDV95DRAFT_541173 [Massariosphaeria phaeospora]
MNFVDVQPKSFLDYAWTSPSPAPTNNAKASKTSRKQNRCCDQCRKGKRACDAAILEDTLLDSNGSSDSTPAVFHYSDVFGPLTQCSNCQKTKKICTFEWLRSQRVSQVAPPSNPTPPAKRRRTHSGASSNSQTQKEVASSSRIVGAPHPTIASDTATCGDPVEFGLTFADFTGGVPALDMNLLPLDMNLSGVLEDETLPDRDSGQGSSIGTASERIYESPPSGRHNTSECSENSKDGSKTSGPLIKTQRKRRRRSSSGTVSSTTVRPTISLVNGLLSSTKYAFLSDGLLKIYHDSFENALACWLTEQTCPYKKDSGISRSNDTGPDWDRIYQRVFRLDRLGRNLTSSEDKAATKAVNLAIFSFATQWALSGEGGKAKYPTNTTFNGEADTSALHPKFDRALQISAWHEAHLALQSAAETESFRFVLAAIVFSLTQKPLEQGYESSSARNSVECSSPMSDTGSSSSNIESQPESKNVSECEDLLSTLSLTLDGERPPTHLEQALRLIHSLRSRMTLYGAKKNSPPTHSTAPRYGRKSRPSIDRLDTADRATVDLLFWLGVMFDTLSSAMHKRPLVVSDEDSDIYASEPRPSVNGVSDTEADEMSPKAVVQTEGLWDDYLFHRQHTRVGCAIVRWPCGYDEAISLLCDAAPIKVLLFRKIVRIQTLLARNVRGARIEQAITSVLDVYDHWAILYAPFIRDCLDNHDNLPPRIQSWYICLTGHWHLATLLFADLLEIIDDSEMSNRSRREGRVSSDFVGRFREKNCHVLSDLAQCVCPVASFPKSYDFNFAVNQGAILTEPWTAVLIRAFAKAGIVLLESASCIPPGSIDPQDAFCRAENCCQALFYLGKRSDQALSVARILRDALKQRRKRVEEQLSDMSEFLKAGLWEGYETHGKYVGLGRYPAQEGIMGHSYSE